MFKKIALITLLVLFSGVLVVGAANRTIAKTEKVNESEESIAQGSGERQYQNEHELLSQENGQGGQGLGAQANDGERQNRNAKEPLSQEETSGEQGRGAQANQDAGQSNGQGGKGQGNGSQETSSGQDNLGQDNQSNQGQGNRNNSENNAQNQQQENYQNQPIETHELLTLIGTVSQAPADGVDMLMQTSDGEMLVGTGPGYLAEQGYVIVIGDELEVTGFWENDEFKVTTITNLEDGSTIALRDELGRPFWSGAARGGGYGKQE